MSENEQAGESLTLHLSDVEMHQVRASLHERRFDRSRSITKEGDDGHDACCDKARGRREFFAEVNAALRQEIATIDGILSRLPDYEDGVS